jgi:hypothetical protein
MSPLGNPPIVTNGREIVNWDLSLRGKVEAVFITEKREVSVTPGLRSRFTLTDTKFIMLP